MRTIVVLGLDSRVGETEKAGWGNWIGLDWKVWVGEPAEAVGLIY